MPHIELRLIIFIGATTYNPAFKINSALLSHLSIHQLKLLSTTYLRQILDLALINIGLTSLNSDFKGILVVLTDLDARRLLNMVNYCQLMNQILRWMI